MGEMEIRRELPEDFAKTEAMTREAFWNQYCPGCVEHYLVYLLRACPAFLPELDFVALVDGEVVGNVMGVKGVIQCDCGTRQEVVTVGPLSVAPEWQRQGIGAKLLACLKRDAGEMGFPALLLCGDPAYYQKQGFLPAEGFGIRTEEDEYAAALQACELFEGALQDSAGRYCENPAYFVRESDAMEFDRQFPEKERRSDTPGQRRFQEVVKMRRKAGDILYNQP